MKRSIASFIIATALISQPFFVFAQTSNDRVAAIQAQIQALMAQLQNLQEQLRQAQGGGAQWCHDFNQNIRFGDYGDEVSALQTALRKEGFTINEIENTFSEAVGSAVSGFQQKYRDEILKPAGLAYGSGFVGAYTRAKLNKLYGCDSKTQLSITTVSLPNTTVGSTYSADISATGGSGSYDWQIKKGSLPPGLVKYTGVCVAAPCKSPLSISGTPTTPGAYTFTVYLTSGYLTSAVMASKIFTITVLPGSPSIQVLSPNGGEVWQVNQNQTIEWHPGIAFTGASPSNVVSIQLQTADAVNQVGCPGYQAGVPGRIYDCRYYSLLDDLLNDGSAMWMVGQDSTGVTIPAGSYYVRIYFSEIGMTTAQGLIDKGYKTGDVSDAPFTITP